MGQRPSRCDRHTAQAQMERSKGYTISHLPWRVTIHRHQGLPKRQRSLIQNQSASNEQPTGRLPQETLQTMNR